MTAKERQIFTDLIEKFDKYAKEKEERSKNETLSDTARDRADVAYWYLSVAANEVRNALAKIDKLSD